MSYEIGTGKTQVVFVGEPGESGDMSPPMAAFHRWAAQRLRRAGDAELYHLRPQGRTVQAQL
jgi:hypothetical protein